MRPHFEGVSPMVHPLVLADRLEQRFEPDLTRSVKLPWFAHDDDTPVFLLGADNFGRDVLSRLLYGARTSIGLALFATLGAVLIGALAGAWAGYRGGWIDDAVMRIADFVLVLPVIYVVLVLRALLPLVLPASTVFLLVAWIFVVVGWPFVAKGVRAIVAVERDREYVLAARSLGAGPLRILTRHLIPACAGHLVVQATLLLPAFILAEATLSFIGLGFPDPIASWGTMLGGASNYNAVSRFPWTLAPAAAIFLVVLATNLLIERAPARQ
jgi:peptide/nickel transport system permease protein